MATDASASLITAIENSLADVDAQWTVVGVAESDTTRVSSVAGNISGGNGSVSSSNTTTHTLIMSMRSGKVRASPGSAAPMQWTYRSIKLGSSFDEAYITINGAEFRSTDASLEATMRSLATAYWAAQDAAAITALNAGPDDSGPTSVPAELLAAIKASLADETLEWKATSRSEMAMTALAPGGGATTTTLLVVALKSLEARSIPESRNPATLVYQGTLDVTGAFVDAKITINQVTWWTDDEDLHDTIVALADAYVELARDNAIEALE